MFRGLLGCCAVLDHYKTPVQCMRDTALASSYLEDFVRHGSGAKASLLTEDQFRGQAGRVSSPPFL